MSKYIDLNLNELEKEIMLLRSSFGRRDMKTNNYSLSHDIKVHNFSLSSARKQNGHVILAAM